MGIFCASHLQTEGFEPIHTVPQHGMDWNGFQSPYDSDWEKSFEDGQVDGWKVWLQVNKHSVSKLALLWKLDNNDVGGGSHIISRM